MNQAFSSTLPVWPRSKSLVSALEARELIALSAPITGTALINMGMSITDTVMMGWIGPDALAAGAVVSDLYSIVYYFMAGILSASAALIAQALGARRGTEVRRLVRQGFIAAAFPDYPSVLLSLERQLAAPHVRCRGSGHRTGQWLSTDDGVDHCADDVRCGLA